VADDAELLAAWRAGDARAGGELVRRHLPSVHRFLRGKLEGPVDDLVQRTFLKCTEAKADVREGASFRAYLLTIARNELYMHLRSGARAPDLVGESRLVDLAPSPSRVADAQGRSRVVVEALRHIPLELQIAIELHYWEELSTAELAQVLDLPHGTIKTRLRRAKELLRDAMIELGASAAEADTSVRALER
jgi:RNA polymerase sigma-70 factor (ECF subfamily)